MLLILFSWERKGKKISSQLTSAAGVFGKYFLVKEDTGNKSSKTLFHFCSLGQSIALPSRKYMRC